MLTIYNFVLYIIKPEIVLYLYIHKKYLKFNQCEHKVIQIVISVIALHEVTVITNAFKYFIYYFNCILEYFRIFIQYFI